jgi:hypothetical protein
VEVGLGALRVFSENSVLKNKNSEIRSQLDGVNR